MVYATLADLENLGPSAALADLSDDSKEAELEAASAFIDSYLENRFNLPLTQVGVDLKKATITIASYELMKQRGFSPESGDEETFERGHKKVVDWLRDISGGKATPVGVVDSSTSPALAREATPAVVGGAQGGRGEVGGFWEHDTEEGSTGVLSTPRRRGW